MTKYKDIFKLLCLGTLLLAMVSCGGADTALSVHDRAALVDSALAVELPTDSLIAYVAGHEATGDKVAVMIGCKHLGKRYRDDSRFELAIKYHNKGLEAAHELADTIEMVRAYNNLGTDLRRMGVMEDAAGYHYKALALTEAMDDHTSDVAVKNRVISLNGIGNIHMTLGNYTMADSALRLALAGEQQLGSALGQAINYANLGSIKQHAGELDSAWYYYRRSMTLNERADSHLGQSLCHTHFGELYEQDRHYDEAVREYETAYDMMLAGSDRWHWLDACQALARVHIKRGDYARAERYIARADSVSTAIGSLEHRAQTYNLKYQLASFRGDARTALAAFVRCDELKDSVVSASSNAQVVNMRINLERERNRDRIEVLNRDYQAERRVKNRSLMGLALFMVLAGAAIAFLAYSLRMRARNQRLMNDIEHARSSFFTNITHEFRTPLTVVMGLSQELKTAPDDIALPRVRSHAQAIERQAGQLLSLVNQLLDVSRISSVPANPDWRHGDIAAQTAMIAEGYRELCRAKHIDLSLHMHDTPLQCDFVPDYVQRIVVNLLANAVKFTSPYGRVRLAVHREGESAVIEVADNGRGISPEDLPHIFDPFYQGENAKHGDMGTGVGLALTHYMTQAMGGTVTVESELGKGSTFVVTLPLKHGTARYLEPDDHQLTSLQVTPADIAEAHLTDDTPDDDSSTLRVLVIEDHYDVAYYIGSQLAQPCEVYYASTGHDGFVKASQLVPDIIITDVMMPDGDGLELCRRLRASEALSHIPIIVISARSTPRDRMAAIEAGADVYMVKPFDGDELRLRVAKLLELRHMLHIKYSTGDDYRMSDGDTTGDNAFIKRFAAVVHAELDKGAEGHLDIETLARTMGMNTAQLRRKLYALTGLKAMAYVTQLRMDRAKHLLEQYPAMPIGEVAERCGFNDLSHFSRIFKLKHGVSPSQFKARL